MPALLGRALLEETAPGLKSPTRRLTSRCRSVISVIRYQTNGATFATVTSGRIWC